MIWKRKKTEEKEPNYFERMKLKAANFSKKSQDEATVIKNQVFTNPVTFIEKTWKGFVNRFFLLVGYILLTVLVLGFRRSSPIFLIVGLILLCGIPIAILIFLISFIPKVNVGSKTVFSRNSLSLKNQIKAGGIMGKHFIFKLHKEAPMLLYVSIFALLLFTIIIFF